MKKIAIIIPCYNEELVLNDSYQRTHQVLSTLDICTEIIYINDGSSDQTPAMLDQIAATDPTVKVIHFSRNFGHQPAVTAGIHHCDADWAIIMDVDMQDPPELIPEILAKAIEEQAHVVYCVRKTRDGESWFKRLTAKLFYRTINRMSEVAFPLDTGDFRLIDRKVMDAFGSLKERGKYIRGLISWIGFKQVPFHYNRAARLAGETKYPLRKMISLASKAMLYFSKKPLYLSINLGFFAFLIGIILAIWSIMGKVLGYSNAESGWTSIIIIVIFFGGVQLVTIGVLGQYIGILFDEVKARPEYIVESKTNFDEKIDASK